MEGTQAAADPAGGGPPGPKIGSKTASPMEVASAVERSGPEPQPDNGHLPRPWPCPREDRTPSQMAPLPPRARKVQLQGPSVLESKVRALKEKMTSQQRVSPCPTSHERSSPKKPKCRRVKSEGSSLPDAVVVSHALNVTNSQLDSSVDEEDPARTGDPRPPRPPTPGLECWNGRSPWPPEGVWALPDHERDLLPGPGSVQESAIPRVTPGRPGGPGPSSGIPHMPSLRKGKLYPLQDGLVTGGDQDSASLTSEEDFVPRTPVLGVLWRAGDLGALGTGGNALSLSDRVERNRVLLQEMLTVSRQSPTKVGSPAWTPSWDRSAPEKPAGDVDWDLGISLQDSDQNRTFGPKPEPVLSSRHEEAKHLLQHARMKARTRPLRASHDIVPTIAQGSRDGRRSPARDPRMILACRDSPQNGNMSDSSSGESSSGQWPKRGISPSHVRFEDESAREAEVRYLERLQQRQRQCQGLRTALPAAGQGPLRSKPDLAHYINGGVRLPDAGQGALHRPPGGLGRRGLPLPLPGAGGERKCRACGSCIEDRHPAESGPHTEWIRETHIGDTTRPEEVDSALDSTDTSDSCRTDSEEAGAAQPSRACGRSRSRGSSPRLPGSRPGGGGRWSRKAEMELPWGLPAPHHLPGVDDVEVGDEVKGGRGHTPEGTLFLREDAVPNPPALESKRASVKSQRQPGSELGNHWAHPVDSLAPCRTAYATTSSTKLGPSGSGRPAQVIESCESLEVDSTSSQQQNYAEPSAPHQAQQPAASLSCEGWVPTPPSSRKTNSPLSHRKAALAGPCRTGDRGQPVDISLPPSGSMVLRTCELDPPQTQPCSPQVRHPLLALSTNNCNNSVPQGLQESWGGAIYEGRMERGPCSQELKPPPENGRDGKGLPVGFLGSADVATVNSTGFTLSLASEEAESSQEPEGGLQRTELSFGEHVPYRASPGAIAGPGPPSAAPSDRNKKRSSSIASALGLKKFFSALGQSARPKLGKSRSYSVEQLQPAAPGLASHVRAPSLQSLHLVTPSHRKAASFQNLHSLLSGKGDRSNLYLVGGPGDHSAAGRPAQAPPRRALSVEDVGAPSLARVVGRVVEVFPDGTSQLQLQRLPEGTFGFSVASGNGRRDSGFYVQEMADLSTAKLYSGLLGVGDEILEVNGDKVARLGLAHIKELLAHSESLSIRVLRQRPVPR
ncbi:uncharacterized protein KIAA1614 homolog [Cynocephalus volans]|uniref:uncharacterized protein KIAA1614 homolog n=1 Tax=Cynocephalus volans TaxID=110931 RepID=UPI002FCC5AB3